MSQACKFLVYLLMNRRDRGREPCSVLSCSPTCRVLVIVCSPADILVITQQVFWCLFLCILMYDDNGEEEEEEEEEEGISNKRISY